MDLGKFDTLIQLQKRMDGRGPLGAPLTVWVNLAQRWADVRHQSGVQAMKAEAQTSTVKASVRILEEVPGLIAGMRALVDGQPYEIKAVLPDRPQRRYVDLVCEVSTS